MGFRDDDEVMDDDEYYDEDDDYEDDDDEEIGFDSRSAINPFASGSSNLPGRNRFGGSSGSSGSNLRDNLASRLGASTSSGDNPPSRDAKDVAADRARFFGSSNPQGGGNRPSSPTGGNRPGTPPGGTRFGSGTGERDRDRAGSPPGGTRFGSGTGSGDRDRDRDRPSTPSGGTRFGGGNRPSSPVSGEKSGSGGSSPFSRSPSGADRTDSGSTSPFSRSSSGGDRDRGGSGGPPPRKPDDKKDDASKSSGGRFGGITGRFGKKDDDSSKAKSGDGEKSGGFASRLPFGGKKDDDAKPKDGGLASRLPFGGGKKDGEKSGGGLASRLPFGGGKKDGEKSGGGFASRLPFGKKDDTAKPRDGGSGVRPAFGGRDTSQSEAAGGRGGVLGRFGGRKPSDDKGRASAAGGGAKASPFGQAKASGQAPARSKADGEKRGIGFGSIAARLPFLGGGKGEKKQPKTSKTRASKVPHAKEDAGLSLDTKLDILGVGLVFGSMVLFFSAISGEQGAVTGAINDLFVEMFGWGMLGVPVAFFAVGMWLILRHFGDDAPEIDPVRVAGLLVLYIGALMVFMFVETFNPIYQYASQETFYLFVQNSIAEGRGGGLVGAELYSFVVTSFGEISAVFFMMGWLVVGIMLTTRTSAAELAIFVISIWRSFQVSMQRRAQKQRALRLEREQQRQLEAAQPISVQKPAYAELGVGASAALPAPEMTTDEPVPIEERPIPIRMGGQMITTNVEAQAQAVNAPAAPPRATPQPAEAESSGGLLGGFASRIRNAVPGLPSTTSKPDEKLEGAKPSMPGAVASGAATAAAAGLGSLLGGRGSNGDAEDEEPVRPKPPVPDLPRAQTAPPAERPSPFARPASQPPASAPEEKAEKPGFAPRSPFSTPPSQGGSLSERLGARPSSPISPTPPSSPADTPEDGEAEKPAAGLRPAASPIGAPDRSPVFTSRPMSPVSSERILEDDDFDDEDEVSEEIDLSHLPPAQPKGLGAAPPRPGGVSPFGQAKPVEENDDFDDEDEDETDDEDVKKTAAPGGALSDRLNRLNAIRAGQTSRPPTQKPDARGMLDEDDDDYDDDAFEDDEDEAVSPEDMVARMNAVRSADPFAEAPPTKKPEPDPNRPYSPFRKPEGAEDRPGTPRPFNLPTTQAATPPKQDETPKSEPAKPVPFQRPAAANQPAAQQSPAQAPAVPTQGQQSAPQPPARPQRQWRLPDARTLLSSGSEQDFDREGLVKRARIIEETLQSFGAPGRVVEINTGPVITQFGVEPDYLTVRGGKKVRVKVGAIAQLDKDMQLALGAKSIRVEAPVPGKGYVGIEVPNDEASLVSLRDVMEAQHFRKINSPLAIALGQSVDGSPIAADLTAMPHLLIAGTTGSGKSVCVNAVIASLLVRNTPDDVKFIMVDPKRVELTGYNGIPHLIAPVVVELERIVGVLKWVTREMDERYKKFSNAGARNITDYNEHLKPGMEKMPYIIVIIDELADLMMLAPEETERVITRIAALARATGIHLVIATQRPSVDVVTGLIKANFPARIAFAVASSVDSRVILDQPGAERLLGRGDMLYMSPDSPAPLRLQGVFVSEMEISNIHRFWRGQRSSDEPQRPITALVMDGSPAAEGRSVIPRGERFVMTPPSSASPQRAFWDSDTPAESSTSSSSSSSGNGKDDDHEDELYGEAVELVRRLNKASVSLLQRRLRIGYTRAARLIDVMEAEGVVGPPTEGSKPREVLPPKR